MKTKHTKGPGRTAAQVYRMIVRELKAHAKEIQLRKAAI